MKRVVWAAVVATAVFLHWMPHGAAQSSGILREVWLDIPGWTIPDLTNAPAYPNNPSFDGLLTDYFESPTDVYDYYGQRLCALITAPATGTYRFWISSDDAGQLFLSTDENPANRVLIAQVTGWTPPRVWDRESGQQSAPISLTAGRRYYIEALMKEHGGGDNLAVRWQLPNGTIEEPIPASRCIPYGLGPPVITVQPTNTTVVEGGTAAFTVQLARMLGATFQWKRNGTNIPGATSNICVFGPVSLSDNNSTYWCGITNFYGSTNSATAKLTVLADTTPPTVVAVNSLGDNSLVAVTFSEPVEATSAGNANNYHLNNGAVVSSVVLLPDPSVVALRTTPLNAGITYTLTVQNVRDRASTPNPVPPNTQFSFSIAYTPLPIGCVWGTNEPAGPSSRRTPLAITEIMYHPPDRPDGRNLEFIELYNSSPWPEDLSGYRISGCADYTFPAGTTVPALGYLVVAANPADIQAVYGISGVLGPLTNANSNATNVLDNGTGTVRLRDELDSVLLEVTYNDEPPWPASADGAGHSLVLARPSYGEADPRAWTASDRIGGSPGRVDTPTHHPARSVVINEILAHTDPPNLDFVELFNYSTNTVDLGGCVLTDDPTTNKFVIPSGTMVPPLGYIAYTETELGFALSAKGETVYLKAADNSRVLDALRFAAQENGVSFGRYPDGAPQLRRLAAVTPGSANASPLRSDVVINEIYYHPVTEDDSEEFIEIHNSGSTTVDLTGWRLRGGVSFNFPSGTLLPSGGYLAVARDRSRLLSVHTGLNPALVLGNYSGGLANSGDLIRLTKPDALISTNETGQFVTNTIHITVDEVDYRDGGRWPNWADGGGSSMERLDPRSDGHLASSWADSDETGKSGWTTVEFTGILDHGAMAAASQLHIILLGAGECLVDNVEVIPQGGANVVANSTFDAGADGWFFQGTHQDSTWQSTGGFSGGCLRIVASDRGDTGANRVRTALTQTLGSGSTATLRARVRWLKGHPEILLRLWGNWLEAPGYTLTTAAMGSPAAPNTHAHSNIGPSIAGVTHWPVLPAANQSVTVTAQIEDPDSLASATLRYRIDPGTNWFSAPMSYRGAGFYSAVIPGQPGDTMVAFYIEASDAHVNAKTSRFPSDAPVRECLIRFGETPTTGAIAAYRLWVSQQNVTRWATREKQSNHQLDATFVYGNSRVCYNVGTLYSGSPWHTPGYNSPAGNPCDYEVNFAKDDLFLGDADIVLATIGNLHSDSTYQGEQTSFWIGRKLGAPYLHRRHIRMFFNGTQRGTLYEDAQQPNRAVVSQFYPNDDAGNLHKIEDWFEFDASGDNKLGNVDATLQDFTTAGGVKKTARYRWIWRPRAVRESANDFTNLFALVDAVNANQPEPYRSRVAAIMDVEEWMRILAMERIVGNWDSYGYWRGKNMYAYKPQNGPWVLLPWDIDFVFNVGGSGATDGLFGSNAPLMDRLRAFPEFQRAYWRAFEDAVNGPLDAATFAARVDKVYNGLVAQGIPASTPEGLKEYAAARRNYILSQLATVSASFAVGGPSSFSTNQNLITLSGTAPVRVARLTVNGVTAIPTWTSVTQWTLRVALQPGLNNLVIQGWDNKGQPIGGATASLAVTYTGSIEPAEQHIVINELMYNPAMPDAEFIEIHSTASSTAYDLSNWRINGLDCTIPPGTILTPGGFLVFVKNADIFSRTYGYSIPVAGTFEGSFDRGGETISLIQPGATPEQDVIIDQVTFDDDPPWPTAADGSGPSLQLIDPQQDNNRVANWAANQVMSNPPPSQVLVTWTNVWRYNQTANLDGVNWISPAYDDSGWPAGQGVLADEDCNCLPQPIRTPLADNSGRMTFYFRTTFNYTGSLQGVQLRLTTILDDGAVVYLNGQEILRIGMPDGTPMYSTPASRTVSDANYEGPFTVPGTALIPGINVLAVEVHQANSSSSDLVWALHLETDFSQTSQSIYTPGAQNSVRATLPPFPTVWLNEVLPLNSHYVANALADRMGDFDPWVELFNAGSNAVSLDGFYLTTNYAQPTLWPFPATASLAPGEFRIVWLDGEPGESTANEWHTNFRLPAGAGTLALTYSTGGTNKVLDYLHYNIATVGRAFGSCPDANVSARRLLTIPTPGAPNNPASLPINVFINEWMADNVATLADPADGNYEDWFEVYNPGDVPVDLGGYYFTDNLDVKFQFRVPVNSQYIVPPRGYLLVWADNESGQNNPAQPDLHVNFALAKSGEAIGLFGADGTLIDAVTFGPQTPDASDGRSPDGSANIIRLPQPSPRAPNLISQSNTPPVLSPIPNRVIGEGSLLTFIATATDADVPPQTLTFTLVQPAPAGASISTNGLFTWIPGESQGPGLYEVTVRVTDNGTPPLSDTVTFSVQVNEVNAPPSILPLASTTIPEQQLYTANAVASDPDQPQQTLTFSIDPGAPAGLSIHPQTGTISWVPSEAQGPGTYFVTVRVTDNGEPPASATQPLTLTVLEVNSAPVLPVQTNRTVNELTTLTVTNTATDADLPANTLTYTLQNPPAGAAIDSSGLISWTPTEAQGPGQYTLTTIVSDNGNPVLRATNSFVVTVIELQTNRPPVFEAQPDAIILAGRKLVLTNVVFDPDVPPQSIVFALLSAPEGLVLDSQTGVLTWRPPIKAAGSTNLVVVSATDSGVPSLSATQSFNVIVLRPASPALRVTLSSEGACALEVNGDEGPDYIIEQTLGLSPAQWEPVLNKTEPALPFIWIAPAATNNASAFYRLRLGP